jgi:hypothetical protein
LINDAKLIIDEDEACHWQERRVEEDGRNRVQVSLKQFCLAIPLAQMNLLAGTVL